MDISYSLLIRNKLETALKKGRNEGANMNDKEIGRDR